MLADIHAPLARLRIALIATLVLALSMTGLSAGTATAASDRFSDVPASHQFREEITWLAQMRVTTGFADGTFKPRDAVTREAFAAFLYRLTGSAQVKLPSRSPFKDVPTNAKFYKEIVWLSQQGITTGWGDGTFRPKDRISREAVAAFLYRLSGKPAFTSPSRSPFKDMTSRSKFYREVTWLANTRITTGYADGTFRPTWNVSREAIAAFLYRGSVPLRSDANTHYEVGRQVFPGTYVSRERDESTPYCIWDRRTNTKASWDGRLGQGADRGRSVATILPSDPYFASYTCREWVPLRATSPNATTFGNGTSAAGYHMRPGTYTSPGAQNCSWMTLADFTYDGDYLETRVEPSTSPQRVRISAGQGIRSNNCGTWTRVGN